MTYYIHESETEKDLFAVTRDEAGEKLDDRAGPWKLIKAVEEDKTRGLIGFPADLEKLNADLDAAGVQYSSPEPRFNAVPSR